MQELRRFLRSERGNAESVLVLIPALLLFLCAAQITTVVFARNFDQVRVQSEASTRAISTQLLASDSVLEVATPNRFQKTQLLVVTKKRELPIFVPGIRSLLGGALLSEVVGVSVMEVPLSN